MEISEETVIVSLLDKDPELKKYYDEHLALESNLPHFSIKCICRRMKKLK